MNAMLHISKIIGGILLGLVFSAFLAVAVQVSARADIIDAKPSARELKLTCGFECSRPLKIKKLSNDHFEVGADEKEHTGGLYLLLRIEGAAGRTVQIDLQGPPFSKWGSPVPQYAYLSDLGDPEGFESKASNMPAATQAVHGRPALPDTQGQPWHYISQVRRQPGGLLLKQAFEKDTAYIALRIPYVPEYGHRFLQTLKGNPNVRVINVGASRQNRPLELVQIPAAGAERDKPCILFYAREHPDEQDCSWIAQGVTQFLTSNDDGASDLRKRMTFLVIPMLDPDGAVIAAHENIVSSFAPGRETPDSLAWAAWFKTWVDAGNRLDLVVPLHNPAPSAAYHVACPMMAPSPNELEFSLKCHAEIRHQLMQSGFTVCNPPWTKGVLPERLSGWLADSYGALVLPYEVNSLTRERQLGLAELRRIGQIMAVASATYLSSESATPLLASIDRARENRQVAWRRFGDKVPLDNAILAEQLCIHHWIDPSASMR